MLFSISYVLLGLIAVIHAIPFYVSFLFLFRFCFCFVLFCFSSVGVVGIEDSFMSSP
ncbi:hypothetical protein F5890DRAFT_1544990 [Lentinula detonsa]|uniref:Uncharacterized protein n=1 Tax=Lentinula detonsa TaxID=2804962 RepID=A0AA38UN33_9AGAR|nr:hypothetical protein F5890DRAFT_1544990 [Lentinula detonsa]